MSSKNIFSLCKHKKIYVYMTCINMLLFYYFKKSVTLKLLSHLHVKTKEALIEPWTYLLGDCQPLDVSSVHQNNTFLKYAVSLLGYGFYGDVLKDSEKKRWMGPMRYDYSGNLNNYYVLMSAWKHIGAVDTPSLKQTSLYLLNVRNLILDFLWCQLHLIMSQKANYILGRIKRGVASELRRAIVPFCFLFVWPHVEY